MMENRTFVGSNNSPALTEHGWHLSDWLNAARINQFGCDLTIRIVHAADISDVITEAMSLR